MTYVPQVPELPQQVSIWNRDKFAIAEKHLAIGDKYVVSDPETGTPILYVKREKFKAHAHIHVYLDKERTQEILFIKDCSWLSFAARFEVHDPIVNFKVGEVKRKGFSSLIRPRWIIRDASGQKIGTAYQDSLIKAFLRIFKLDFHIKILGEKVGKFVRKWSIRDKYLLDVSGDPKKIFDRRLALALGIILDTEENR